MDSNLPLTIDEVRGRDLPKAWAERAGIGPDDLVRITIAAPREAIAAELGEALSRIGVELQRAGIAPETILKEIPDFPRELLRD